MPRPEICAFLATSVDGFIAGPNGDLDWLGLVEAPGEDYGYRAFAASIDTVVLGRKTYDVARAFPAWPHAGKRAVVLTHAAAAPGRHGESFFSGAPDALAALLEGLGARRVYADGGTVVSQLLEAGLLDELTLSLVPLLLGEGTRLFRTGPLSRRLALEGSRAFPSGLVQLRYRAAGRLTPRPGAARASPPPGR
ncbi:MAG TPA: dihydrofolate reductase family protein [Anaeromyxobacter sp.]|nr:dihydrofolate reductase family protein [Anaeromyxobacter sp.]